MTAPSSQAEVQHAENGASVVSPIADLTYRHYDGPLKTRAMRWWIVALAGIRQAVRKWWFWLLVLLSMWPYVFNALMLYLRTRLGPEFERALFSAAPGQTYATVFFRALDAHLFWLMVIGLVVGAGSIAADNRTSALQVYLAKPITKADYLLGKWMSVFLTVFVAAIIPSLLLYVFCLLSFWSEGFVTQEPWLIVKVVAVALTTAAGYASLFVGVSAWCRSGMMSAAISAGVYFASGIVAGIVWLALYIKDIQAGNVAAGVLVQSASFSGILKGVAWNIYGVTVRVPMMGRPSSQRLSIPDIHPPALWVMLSVYAAIVIGGLLAARWRIRAVEVIKG